MINTLDPEVLTLTTRSGLTVAEALAEAAKRFATKDEVERIVFEALEDVAVDAQWEREASDLHGRRSL